MCSPPPWETGLPPCPPMSWTLSLLEPSNTAELVLGNFRTQDSRAWHPSLLEGWRWGPAPPWKKSASPRPPCWRVYVQTPRPGVQPEGSLPPPPPKAPGLGPLAQPFHQLQWTPGGPGVFPSQALPELPTHKVIRHNKVAAVRSHIWDHLSLSSRKPKQLPAGDTHWMSYHGTCPALSPPLPPPAAPPKPAAPAEAPVPTNGISSYPGTQVRTGASFSIPPSLPVFQRGCPCWARR